MGARLLNGKSIHYLFYFWSSARNRLEAFIQSRSEWCISRQRTWGVPIPTLYDEATNTAVLEPESITHIVSVLSEKGASYWWEAPVDEFLTADLKSSGKTYRKGTDTMDVWFDSGSAWTMVGDRSSGGHLADVILEGSDQHRGWFQSLLLTYLSANGPVINGQSAPKAPYKTIITHGFVLDDALEKMSKSDGNVISPVSILNGTAFKAKTGKVSLHSYYYYYYFQLLTLFDAFFFSKAFRPQGADVIRVWAATSDYTTDISIGRDVVDAAIAKLDRFRRLLKFCLGNLRADTKPIRSFDKEDLTVVWLPPFLLDRRA